MSKKEEQRRRREQKKQAAKRREKIQSWVIRGAVAVLVPLALYVFYQGLFGGEPAYPPDQVGPNDHVRGPSDAPLTITVYADFQCPACLTETQVISRAWPRIRDRVRLVFRHFPLDTHRHAFLAARYAEAAGRQGRFWEMHDLLFVNQQSWSVMDDPRQAFNSYALELGLDMEQLQADLESNQVRAKIVADQRGGVRAGVRSTPTMFFNGNAVANPQTAGQLVEMVDEALAGEE